MLNCNLTYVHSQYGSAGTYHGEQAYLQGLCGLDVTVLLDSLSIPTTLYAGLDGAYLGVTVHFMQSVTTEDGEEYDNFSIEGEASAVYNLLQSVEKILVRQSKTTMVETIDQLTVLLEQAKARIRRKLKPLDDKQLSLLN